MSFFNRLKKVAKSLNGWGVDGIILNHPIDLYYLTGLRLSEGCLFISNHETALLLDGRYFENAEAKAPCKVFLRGKDCFSENLQGSLGLKKGSIWGFDGETVRYKDYLRWYDILAKQKKIKLLPLEGPIKTLRRIKEEKEIVLLKEAAKLAVEGFKYVCSILCEGISEREVAQKLEVFWLNHGGEKLSFAPIIAFGPNASMPHHESGEATLKKNQAVLIDLGVLKGNYNSDMTRMVFFGKIKPQMVEIYEVVKEAQRRALGKCRAGASLKEIDQAARKWIMQKGYDGNFTHSLGHGVGLEIHELPRISALSPPEEVLKEGMVVTIEPGIYLPKVGGVRLEDTIVIRKNGFEKLTDFSVDPVIVK